MCEMAVLQTTAVPEQELGKPPDRHQLAGCET